MSDDLKDLVNRIESSLNNLVTLEIITAVGQVIFKPQKDQAQGSGISYPDIDYNKKPKVILTKINLLQGDIKTIYDEEFVTGSYTGLRDFHADREKEGYEIVHKNLAALKELLDMVKKFIEG